MPIPDERCTDDTRPFPIQQGGAHRDPHTRAVSYPKPCTVPWWLAEVAYGAYVRRWGKEQTLERLAERGGCTREELLELLGRAP